MAGDNGLHRREYATVTTMFVTNLPDGTRKEIVKKIFSRYGSIVDVYMATKKDSNNKNFAFVISKGVQNDMQLEASLQELKCLGSVLEINVAKFVRNAIPVRPGMARNKEGDKKNLHHTGMGSFCDGRSFAAILFWNVGRPFPPPPLELTKKPITLEDDLFLAHWICSQLILVGIAHSLEHKEITNED